MLYQSGAVFGELADRVSMIGLAGITRPAAIKNDRAIALRQKRHDADFPGITRPPRRRCEQHRLALSLLLIIHGDVADLNGRHVQSSSLALCQFGNTVALRAPAFRL